MAKLSTKQHSQAHRVLLFGPPKGGKTQLAGALAKHYNLIWVDMENGHETLFKLTPEEQARIELINLKDTSTYPIAIETVLKMIKGKVSICEEHGKVGCMICKRAETDEAKLVEADQADLVHSKYFTDTDLPNLSNDTVVVFDSITQLVASSIAHMTRKEDDEYKLTWDDWGNLGKLMEIFFSHIQQANYNVICISHEVESETEGGKKVIVPVAGTRNFSRNVAKYFDHVVYVEKKNKKHVAASSTTYATNILTGSRTDVKLEDLDEISLLPIFKPELFNLPAKPKVVSDADRAKDKLSSLLKKNP